MTGLDTPASASQLDRATLLAAMRVAARAPSVHNTQPWRWIYRDNRLNLYRDDQRVLGTADPNGRQLVISCGTMLHHTRIAFAAVGWRTETVRLPDPSRPDHLATLTFRPLPNAPTGLRNRPETIERRRTDRLPLRDPGDLTGLVRSARLLSQRYEVMLDILDAATAGRLGAASEHVAALRHYDIPYLAELYWWNGHEQIPDGVPAAALVSADEAARVPVGREFPSSGHTSRRGDQQDRARLWVLATEDDSALAWLRTGEALSEILLECTAAGLATCPLTHITELPTTRRIASNAAGGHGTAQVIVRVGLAPDREDHPQTPRRPVSDFLTIHPDTFAAGSGERPAVSSACSPTAEEPGSKDSTR
ncbi:Acg family FMN-binding oxidoreductase [Nocardia testacea]|uniref:Acg family FMN-binding oxidoreductase n=1 Tax=Nocardia testacea TaxID=248551 RepID=UPI003C2C7C41